jgi:hypothetical protein
VVGRFIPFTRAAPHPELVDEHCQIVFNTTATLNWGDNVEAFGFKNGITLFQFDPSAKAPEHGRRWVWVFRVRLRQRPKRKEKYK